ncbi:phosphate acyltransferase PlsX [Streptococcus sp. P25B114]|uniref:phosphate acyltransferase PlsX n=1 Tax=Streptococcus suis TaxID=1307 RepID=UPI00211D68AB|nr:phosphate acyltransferase PlsX [Streptococcus suis]UUM57246.1 phosphate acyltransferase PlsX [Streptococcus suis]
MKRIAVDAMGGDHAPQAVIEGVNQALKEFSDIEIQLYGDEAKIKPYLTASERVTIIHTDEKINSDDEPVRAIRRKKNSSMVLATQAVKDGQADAVLSAGNTGALLAAGVFVVGRIKNIDRPGLMSTLPTMDGKGFDMMDLGANAENTAHHLYQYGIMGSFYAEHVRGVKNPRVALLNNGTEETKGTPVHQEAFALLSQEPSINFIGNVEARELLNGVADVVVTDGFTGNAVLKTVEGTAKSIVGQLTGAIKSGSFLAKIGGLLLKPTLKKALGALDYKTAGGAVLLGLKAPVIKAHGSSDATAIFYTIKQVRQILDANIVEKSVAKFSPVENNHD